MMDGRVKTLHPRLYAGLLARRDEEDHLRAAAEQQIEPVDLVCVNLYPFEQTVARGDATEEEVIENIDIGGPTMIRAAAKNSAFAAVVVDPADYERVLAELRESGGASVAARRANSSPARRSRAPRATTPRSPPGSPARRASGFPDELARAPTRRSATCATARTRTSAPPSTRARARPRTCSPGVEQLHGKELSFNNLLDLSSARELVEEFAEPAVRDRQAQQPVRRAPSATSGQRGLRTRLRVRPAERLRRRDRAQPPGRPRVRAKSSASSSSRCCSRPATTPTRSRCCGSRRTCACSPVPDGGARRLAGAAARGRIEAGDRRAARADRTTSSQRRASRCTR